MKFFVITIIILSVFVIPVAYAESAPEIFVQVIHRDSDGNLLAYIKSNTMNFVALPALNFLLNYESSLKQDPIYEMNGEKLQVITRQFVQTFDSQTMVGNTQLLLDTNNVESIVVEFIHDGFRVISGDSITTVWSFARLV